MVHVDEMTATVEPPPKAQAPEARRKPEGPSLAEIRRHIELVRERMARLRTD
jgi:hypothetical protein